MKKLTCLFALFLPFFLLAQTNVDSLIHVLETQKLSEKEQFHIYKKICNVYLRNDADKVIAYAEKGLKLAESKNDKERLCEFHHFLGTAYYTKGVYDVASSYFEKALSLAVETKNKQMEAMIYGSIANIHTFQSEEPLALEYSLKALAAFEEIGDKKYIAVTLCNISGIYEVLQNKEQSFYYLQQAEVLAEELNDDYIRALVYRKLAVISFEKGEFDKAIEYDLKTLEYSRSIGDKQGEVLGLEALAYDFMEKGDYKTAEQYALECLRVSEEQHDPRMNLGAQKMLSTIYLEMKRYEECKNILLKAWENDSLTIQKLRIEQEEIFSNLIQSYIYLGDKDKAVYFFKKYEEAVATYSEQGFQESLADMQTKYETEKKETRIAALEKERNLYVVLGIAVVVALLLGLGLLFYRHRLAVQNKRIAEQQINQLQQEKELMAVRLSLQVEKTEREIIARDLHDGVGAMLSVVINNLSLYSSSEKKEEPYFKKAFDLLGKSITELSRVAHHIMPATLVEKGLVSALDDFCRSVPEVTFYATEKEYRFDPEKELVLYRCAYELINNALKHSKASQISVHLNTDGATVFLTVEDDGCGFDPQAAQSGMGIHNIRTRLSVFGGRMDIYSEVGKGTEVNVELDV